MPPKGKQLDAFVFQKYFSNEILYDYDKPIRDLISVCDSAEKFALIEHILDNIKIYSDTKIGFAVNFIKNKIIAEVEHEHRVAIVATAFDGDPDSSQNILYKLKPLMREHKNIDLYSYMPKYLTKASEYNRVFIIDDFSGTGKTIIQRYKTIKKRAKEINLEVDCSVILVAAMETAVKNIRDEGIHVDFMEAFKAGITGFFSGTRLEEMSSAMLQLESNLRLRVDDVDLPSFGYGGAEAMFSLHKLNAPNSNFPLLWWPEYSDGQKRETIFSRNQ